MAKYQTPDWFTRRVMNKAVMFGVRRLGLDLLGARILVVRGRKTGNLQRTPVNVLTFEGARYLVAPRGETQWVRNVRAAKWAGLRRGRHIEQVRLEEVADNDKVPVLREYLKRWRWEVGQFFDISGPDASNNEIRKIAPDHPVFRVFA